MRKRAKRDTSPVVSQRDKLKQTLTVREFPWTEKQKRFIQLAQDKNTKIIFVDGLWGTAKTLLAVYCSLKLLADKKISDIIYIRNPVESTKHGQVGFLKGSVEEKIAPYTAPFFDKLEELLPPAEVNKLKEDKRVNCYPVGHLRGLSWNCKAVIVDEASCMTKEDLFLTLSRVGEFSKVFVIGDTKQNDIGKHSGFAEVFAIFKQDQESIDNGVITMEFKDESDILRSKLLRFLMKKMLMN